MLSTKNVLSVFYVKRSPTESVYASHKKHTCVHITHVCFVFARVLPFFGAYYHIDCGNDYPDASEQRGKDVDTIWDDC
jgi:hypothetical protein